MCEGGVCVCVGRGGRVCVREGCTCVHVCVLECREGRMCVCALTLIAVSQSLMASSYLPTLL